MQKDCLEIDKRALKLRGEYNVDSYGINDLFALVEKMNIYLIRIPLGYNSICGFTTVYEGKKVIVSNSSEILAREIFTVAHEIAHCEYDLDVKEQKLIVDAEVATSKGNLIEKRADYFAVSFLMPENKIRDYIRLELEKRPDQIRAIDIIRIQIEFNVSFAMVVKRLHEIGLIEKQHRGYLFDKRDSKTSRSLFKVMNLSEDLLEPALVTKVPNKYFEYVFSNFENGYIKFDKFKEALEVVKFDTSELIEPEIIPEEDEDIEELLQGY